jgi:alcohol dehydrogenase
MKASVSFELYTPQKIVFGNNRMKTVATEARRLGGRALVVSGKNSMRKTGVLDSLTSLLRSEGVKVEYCTIEHEPTVDMVDAGKRRAEECACDLVIALGGGSVIDAGKAIAGMIGKPGSITEYQSGKEIKSPGLPLIAIPTTAGSGAEVTKNAVLTNPTTKKKQSVRSEFFLARVVIVDPLLTISLPQEITAASGMDALTQAIECLVSPYGNPFSEALAYRAIELLSSNILPAYNNGNNTKARVNMALGSLITGLAFANTGLGAVHGIAHAIGGIFNLPHGVICALLLPHIVSFNYPAEPEKFARVKEAMGLVKSGDEAPLVTALAKMSKAMHLPGSLSKLGITRSDFPAIIERSWSSSMEKNPRPVTEEEVFEILRMAL